MSVRDEPRDPALADVTRLRDEVVRLREERRRLLEDRDRLAAERDRLAVELRRARVGQTADDESAQRLGELRAALTAIGRYGRCLLDRLTAAEAEARGLVERICRAAEWAMARSDPRRALAAPPAGPQELVDLNATVIAAEPALRWLLGAGHELVLDLEPGLEAARGAPAQVERLLEALALAAREVGASTRVTVTTAAARLDVGARRPGGPAVMLGVSEARLGGDAAGAAAPAPAGSARRLALAVAADLVDADGALWLDHDRDRGTTFELYLPRAGEPQPALATGSPGESPRETVLVVEDEPQVRDLIRDVLALHGYGVLTAADGVEALAVEERYPGRIDLLLLDVVVPGVPAEELVRRLLARRPHIKVVYMSGYTDDLIRQHGLLRVGRDFLQKPFTVDALARKVREVLDEPA